jgi:predicted Rossmann-fold nucleotide-binding protein
MIVEKVISGGQTGVDQAGLRAAKDSGISTGGWLPNGCITLEGSCPDLLELYSMQEHPRKGYPARTEANVRDSDGIIRFAENFKTSGEKCRVRP